MRSLSFMFLCSLSFLFSTNYYYVETTGTDNPDCSQSSPCEHIQTAIELTIDGDVVMVSPGTYVENILIETAITVQGSDPLSPAMIDGSSPDPSSPNAWNESCVVIKTPRGRISRISATIQDIKVTGGKGTMVIIDGNKDGDFDDVGTGDDISKKVGGGIIVSNANMTGRRLQVVNNGDASTKEGGGVYAAGTGAGVPDNNPNLPPLPGDDERSSIVFEESIFSGNDALVGNTVMVNGWDPENQFINMDFGNAQFDIAFDSDDNEFDGVSEHWVRGLDNAAFDYTGGITGESDAIVTGVWVDPVNGWDEGNVVGDSLNPFLTINHAMGMIYPTLDNPITIHLMSGTYSPINNGESFPIVMLSNINLIGEEEEITILDANQSNRVININGIENSVITNLTITGGYNQYVDWIGGNVGSGAGLLIADSEMNFSNVTIKNNYTYNLGGGLRISKSNVMFEETEIWGNTAEKAGGISILESYVSMEKVSIHHNLGYAAGLDASCSSLLFRDVEIIYNQSDHDAGCMQIRTGPTIYSCPETDYDVLFMNVFISNNSAIDGHGAGRFDYIDPILINVTVTNNMDGWGLGGLNFYESSPIIINSILWNNNGSNLRIDDESIANSIVIYSDIEGGFEGEGNIDADPLFVDPENGDYSLQENSPCIDAGTADLDDNGQNDITDYYGQAPDMGAFEFGESTMIPGDVTGDGQLNILDVVALVNIVLGYADPIDSGDLNGDGSLNVLDVVALVEIILNP